MTQIRTLGYDLRMDIREITALFANDEDCLKYLAEMRWPDGVIRCPDCGCKNIKRVERSITKKGKNRRGWFYLCGEKTCGNQFTPTSGTLFHDTHLPLIVWFHAVALMLNGKKGISAKQMQRDLGIGGYKTAWYLNHRIREAMAEGAIPAMGGIVEIDETYLGGRQRGHEGKSATRKSFSGCANVADRFALSTRKTPRLRPGKGFSARISMKASS